MIPDPVVSPYNWLRREQTAADRIKLVYLLEVPNDRAPPIFDTDHFHFGQRLRWDAFGKREKKRRDYERPFGGYEQVEAGHQVPGQLNDGRIGRIPFAVFRQMRNQAFCGVGSFFCVLKRNPSLGASHSSNEQFMPNIQIRMIVQSTLDSPQALQLKTSKSNCGQFTYANKNTSTQILETSRDVDPWPVSGSSGLLSFTESISKRI